MISAYEGIKNRIARHGGHLSTAWGPRYGKFVECGGADEVILTPKADYTKRLISDVPKIYKEWDLSTV